MKVPFRTVLGFSVGSLLAGCAGSAFPTPPPQNPTTQTQSLSSPTQQNTTTTASIVAQPRQLLLVTDGAIEGVLAFRLTDNGNVAPQFTIAGSATGLSNPSGLAVARDGRVGVENVTDSSAELFAPGARGNVRPLNMIRCGGITVPLGAAFDGSGNFYATNGHYSNSITVFAPAAAGCVSGNRVIQGPHTQLNQPYDILVDASGAIYVSNGSGASVAVFAPGASGDATPQALIAGSRTGIGTPGGVALDSGHNLYVADFRANSILVFAPGANGNAVPVRTIIGPHTQLNGPDGIGLDIAGNLYVVNAFGASITVYSPNARGDAAPLRTLSGSNTKLLAPHGLAIAN